MSGRICVAIRETRTKSAAAAAARAATWADLVEVRADYLQDLDLDALLRNKPCPILFTLRSPREGGAFEGSERTRMETLVEAVGAGADYVDVEFSSFWKGVLDNVPREKVILSWHDLEGTATNLEDRIDAMAATGAGALKIATTAVSLGENLRIRKALEHARRKDIRLCALAMGRPGIPSRILGCTWGSWMTFASLPGGEPTADGQIPADALVEIYRLREIGAGTEVYGVLGRPLGHSLSPQVHNAAFASRGKDAVFVPMEASDLEDFLGFRAAVDVRGASVTIPYKEEACTRAYSLSVEAQEIGAVNTVVFRKEGWHGENTDVDGFLRPLRRRKHMWGCRAVVLGAGGAARAVVYGLRSQGAKVCVVARDPEKAQKLADAFRCEHEPWSRLPRLRWDLLVNATPVGMFPETDASPVPAESLTGEWVYDLVYNPGRTRLLEEAEQRGCGTISGREMFLVQAAKQHKLWCGAEAPAADMEAAFDAAVGRRVKGAVPPE